MEKYVKYGVLYLTIKESYFIIRFNTSFFTSQFFNVIIIENLIIKILHNQRIWCIFVFHPNI